MAGLSHRPASIDPHRAHAIAAARFRAPARKLPCLAGWGNRCLAAPRVMDRPRLAAGAAFTRHVADLWRFSSQPRHLSPPSRCGEELVNPRPLAKPRAHVDRSHQVPGPVLREESRGPAPKRLPSCHDRPGFPGRRPHQVLSGKNASGESFAPPSPARRRSARQHVCGAPSARKAMRRTDFCLLSLRAYEHPRLIGSRCGSTWRRVCFTTDGRLRWTAGPHGACAPGERPTL